MTRASLAESEVREAMRVAIQELMSGAGLTNQHLGHLIGAAPGSISRWRQGTAMPSLPAYIALEELAAELGLRHWSIAARRALRAAIVRIRGRTRPPRPQPLQFVEPVDIELVRGLRAQGIPWRDILAHHPPLLRRNGSRARPGTTILRAVLNGQRPAMLRQ